MNNKLIYELRVVCRSGNEGTYPFEVHTDGKYYYADFDDAEEAVKRLAKEYAQKDWKRVYRYGIYAYMQDAKITNPDCDAVDAVIYLPDGTRWISNGTKGVLRNGEVYERIVGNRVDLGIMQDASTDEFCRCRLLEFGSEYNIDRRVITQIMPCSLPVSEAYVEAMQSKRERYEAVERSELTPSFGLPYDAQTIYDEDMDDYLYVPASFSGVKYDLFFDCKAAYQKNMHPMWFYVAHSDGDKMVLIPITVSENSKVRWDKYEQLDCELDAALSDFITFNLRDIMTLADHQCKPDYFLWNLTRMEDIDKFLNSLGHSVNEL